MDTYLDLRAFCKTVDADYPALTLYCLADHAGMPGLPEVLLQAGTQYASLFAGSKEENAVSVAPLLFSLKDAERKRLLLEWIARHGTFSSSMLMLASPMDIPSLTARLAARLDVTISDEMNVMFRFFDPRVFEAMLQIFSEERKAAFLGIAASWWYVDRSGQMVCVPSAFRDADDIDDLQTLSSDEEFAFVDASAPDQIAQLVATMLPEQYGSLHAARRFSFIQQHSAAATALDIHSIHDVAMYCGLVLLHGEGFADRPEWTAILASVKTGKVTLMDAVIEMETENEVNVSI